MKVSVVIPAHNAEETLASCLEALFVALEGRKDWEVIVVDDGSKDRTTEVAHRFPVRLLRSEQNEGRIRAREMGARAAKADRILFVDTRFLTPPDAFQILESLGDEPVMGGSASLNVQDGTALDRFLYLLRKRIYAPYYPQGEAFPLIQITPQNFDRVPKGMGFFYIDKARFLEALPKRRTKDVNDDTRIFSELVKTKPILVPRDLRVVYLHRTSAKEAFRHIFERGPRFADFHFRPGGRYYPAWVFGWVAAVLGALVMVFQPYLALGLAVLVFVLVLAASVWLAETLRDAWRLFTVLPVVGLLFGLGILKGKYLQAQDALIRIWKHVAA